MQTLSEQTLAAIGRMTVAATDLEHLLAWIGADRAGGDAAAVFARPGEPLVAARGSVQFAAAPVRDQLIAMVEAAGTQLALSHAVLRRLWRDEAAADPGLTDQNPAGPEVFDSVADRLVSSREALRVLLEAQLRAAGR